MIAAEELSDDRLPRWKALVLIGLMSLAFWVVIVALSMWIAR